jgi:antitoxin component YwqK of YwqJK toxin-antitoxin module
MKKLLAAMFVALLMGGCGDEEIKDGLHTEYYENGQKGSEETYKDGKKDGLWTWWYKNGQKAQEENMRDGKPEGFATEYYEDGQRKTEENYKDGKIVTAVV